MLAMTNLLCGCTHAISFTSTRREGDSQIRQYTNGSSGERGTETNTKKGSYKKGEKLMNTIE